MKEPFNGGGRELAGRAREEERREGYLAYKRPPHVSGSILALLSSSACDSAKTTMQSSLRG